MNTITWSIWGYWSLLAAIYCVICIGIIASGYVKVKRFKRWGVMI